LKTQDKKSNKKVAEGKQLHLVEKSVGLHPIGAVDAGKKKPSHSVNLRLGEDPSASYVFAGSQDVIDMTKSYEEEGLVAVRPIKKGKSFENSDESFSTSDNEKVGNENVKPPRPPTKRPKVTPDEKTNPIESSLTGSTSNHTNNPLSKLISGWDSIGKILTENSQSTIQFIQASSSGLAANQALLQEETNMLRRTGVQEDMKRKT
jgi:hypothetical protein